MCVTLLIFGDICPDWGFPALFAEGSPEKVFHDILPAIRAADYAVANLEAPATDADRKLQKNSVNLKARPSDVRLLRDAGFRALALANNHILDYGVEGLRDTVSLLRQNQLSCYGAGSREDAAQPHTAVLSGVRVGFLAFAEHEFNCASDYGAGANLWDDLDGIRAIQRAKEACDYLIVQYHGGIEHYRYPSPLLQKRCRAMVDAGADFVTCQHSHVIGTRESWNGGEILYGQGNAVFGYSERRGDSWNTGLICKLELTPGTNGLESKITYIPIAAESDGEKLAQPPLRDEILASLEQESAKIADEAFIRSSWAAFCKKQALEYLPMQFGWGINMERANRLFKGKLVDLLVKKTSKRNAMNLIRCDAHREVVATILEDEFYGAQHS